MEVFYYLVFGALAGVVAALELGKSVKDRVATSPAFNSFKNNYILVYSLMMCTPRGFLPRPLPLLPSLASNSRRPAALPRPDLEWRCNACGFGGF
jgi:hypothetical protein